MVSPHWERLKKNQEVFRQSRTVLVNVMDGAIHETGYSRATLVDFIRGGYHKISGMFSRMLWRCPKGLVVLYARKVPGRVDLGTKKDMGYLGLEDVCNMLDGTAPKE